MFVCAAILTSSGIPDFVSTLADSLFQCRFHVKHPLELTEPSSLEFASSVLRRVLFFFQTMTFFVE